MNIEQARATDLTDTVGATAILSERFSRRYSIDSLWQLVKQNRLRAFMFHEGKLVERAPDATTRGKDLIFLIPDLYDVEPPRPVGRPAKIN